MGVAGSGKSTVGGRLAQRLGLPFIEGDDFHDPGAMRRMATGQPLTEAQRGPWLDRLHAALVGSVATGAVCACSALTEAARRRLTAGLDDVRLVWLNGPADLISDRLARRPGHSVGATLLPSQLDTLEPPAHALQIDVHDEPDRIVERIVDWLDAAP